MSDKKYVSAELVKAEFTGNFQESYTPGHIKALIDGVPAADVQEVRHGKWILVSKNKKQELWQCDTCERLVIVECGDNVNEIYPYCHCGAKMDGDKQ